MSELYLTDKEYLIVLKRLRAKIAKDTNKVSGYDDTTIGSKHTECNVGLCRDDPEVYTKEMNLFPDQYPLRVSPKYRDKCGENKHYCPLSKKHKSWGCFYDCLYFQNRLTDRKKILELYEKRIAELENKAVVRVK